MFPKTLPPVEEITALALASSKEARIATSLLIVQVISRDPVIDCPVVSMVVVVGALMNFPENSTGTPAPYLVRTYGIKTPRLSVVTVTFKKWERRYVTSRVFPVVNPDSRAELTVYWVAKS